MKCSRHVHPRPPFLHLHTCAAELQRGVRFGAEVAFLVSWPQGAPGSGGPPAGTGARRLCAPGRPARGAGTRRASEGSCRVTFPREGGPSSSLEASLPFVCFPAGGWRAAGFLLLCHAPRGPCVSPVLLGVPALTPRPVLAGIAPILSSRGAAAPHSPEELCSPQGRAPACVRRASKWGQGSRGFCRATCHSG